MSNVLENIPALADIGDLANAIRRGALLDMNCARPATVTAFSRKGRPHCSVQLGHEMMVDDGSVVYSDIEGLPILYPQLGSISIQADLEIGDEVLVLFSDRQLDTWLEAGGTVQPATGRLHDMSDAMVLPGLPSNKNVPSVNPGPKTLYLGGVDGETYCRIDVSGTGKVTVEAGGIDLGKAAVKGAARVGDPTSVSALPADPWQVWFAAVAGATGTGIQLADALGVPISTVTTGSTKTRIE